MATNYGSPTFKAFAWTDESNIPGHDHEEAKDMKSAEETKAFVGTRTLDDLRHRVEGEVESSAGSNCPHDCP